MEVVPATSKRLISQRSPDAQAGSSKRSLASAGNDWPTYASAHFQQLQGLIRQMRHQLDFKARHARFNPDACATTIDEIESTFHSLVVSCSLTVGRTQSSAELASGVVQELKPLLRSSPTVSSLPPSFSTVVKLPNAPTTSRLTAPVIPPATLPIIVLPAADAPADQRSTDVTRRRLWEAAKKDPAAWKVVENRRSRDGGLLLRAQDAQTLSSIKAAALANNMVVKEPTSARPRLRIHRVDATLTPHDLVEAAHRLNLPDLTAAQVAASFTFVGKAGPRDRRTCDFIFSCSPVVRTRLLEAGSFLAGFSSQQISDHVSVLRCAKCLGFGHHMTTCTVPQLVCSHCAQSGHTREECSERDVPAKCVNCIRFKEPLTQAPHGGTSTECPCFLRAMSAAIKRTNYTD